MDQRDALKMFKKARPQPQLLGIFDSGLCGADTHRDIFTTEF